MQQESLQARDDRILAEEVEIERALFANSKRQSQSPNFHLAEAYRRAADRMARAGQYKALQRK